MTSRRGADGRAGEVRSWLVDARALSGEAEGSRAGGGSDSNDSRNDGSFAPGGSEANDVSCCRGGGVGGAGAGGGGAGTFARGGGAERVRRRGRAMRRHVAREDREGLSDRRTQKVDSARSVDAADRAARRQIGEHVFEEIRRHFTGQEHLARRRAARDALQHRARRVGRGAEVLFEHGGVEHDAFDLHRVRAGRGGERASRGGDRAREQVEQRPRELAANRLGARRDHEPARAHGEEHRERAFAALVRTVAGGARGLAGGAAADVDLVEERGVAHGHARVLADAAHELEQEARRQIVEASAHFAVAAEARFDARPGAQHFADAREYGARVALFTHGRRGAGAELADTLEEILLPREENDGRVAEGDVAPERAAQGEAVEPRHEDVADDELGLHAEREVARREAVERLVHFAARGAKEVGDEPGDAGVVVGDDDAAAVEAHVGAGSAAARRRPVGRGYVVMEPGRERGWRPRARRLRSEPRLWSAG